MLRACFPRRAMMASLTVPITESRGMRWMASISAQRSSREPCLVTCPRVTLVSDSRCRGSARPTSTGGPRSGTGSRPNPPAYPSNEGPGLSPQRDAPAAASRDAGCHEPAVTTPGRRRDGGRRVSMNLVEASGLGKRYGRTWALRECTLAVPAGHVAALVGPNGAGKTTLLNLAVGLTVPTVGAVTVLGGRPPGSPAALDGIAFVAQDTPVYKNLSAADMLHLTRNLNRRFDQPYAQTRLGELGIPLNRKAGRLSGGQQAQLALTLALARRPKLLVLDEPVAMLDPIARHDFMASLLTAAAADGVSVVLSSHVLAELERVADYLILLSRGQVQVAGEVDDLLAGHRLLTGPAAEAGRYAGRPVVHARGVEAQAHLLVRAAAGDPVPPGFQAHPVGLEELALAYLREPGAAALPGPASGRGTQPTGVTR